MGRSFLMYQAVYQNVSQQVVLEMIGTNSQKKLFKSLPRSQLSTNDQYFYYEDCLKYTLSQVYVIIISSEDVAVFFVIQQVILKLSHWTPGL